MRIIQDLVNRFESLNNSPFLRYLLVALSAVLIAVVYDVRLARNFAAPEAMDSAQLGRNIAEGRGYTTHFVRPFSMFLIMRETKKHAPQEEHPNLTDLGRIREGHPDIANPPVYPLLLAGLFRVVTPDFDIGADSEFARYKPDFIITIFNQILFVGLLVLVFLWARRMFDPVVAWTSLALVLGSELLWRFSASGLSTILLMLIFMALVWCLTLLEGEAREPRRGPSALFIMAAVAGALVGIGGLTRYAFVWLIIPVLAFLILFTTRNRPAICVTAVFAFLIVFTPWIVRNISLSGAPFGVATYNALSQTVFYPEFQLERSIDPNIQVFLRPIWIKFMTNVRGILQTELFGLSSGLAVALFFAGLLVSFRNPTIRRVRYFVVASLVVFVIAQAIGQTQLSVETPQVNTENLIVIMLPLMIIFGVSLIYILLDQINAGGRELKAAIVGTIAGVSWLPLFFSLVAARQSPIVYPPYLPPAIRQNGEWMKPGELTMTDIPWAYAWYGDRQAVWLTLNAMADPQNPRARENFFEINDFHKPVSALYLTPRTTDGKFYSEWWRGREFGWGHFVLNILLRKEVPRTFPLSEMPTGYLPQQLFLTDRKRWADEASQ